MYARFKRSMSSETPKPSQLIEARLAQIDRRPFLGFVMTTAREVSPHADLFLTQNLLQLAIRCACLLDDFSETDNTAFLKEFHKQKEYFYTLTPAHFHDELREVENDVKQFFEEERSLALRIRGGDQFSWRDIQKYILGKSGDNLFYGKILELTTPGWTADHTEGLRLQTILFDIEKDIQDYSDDVPKGLPNVLYMGLTTTVKPENIPHDNPNAVSLATQVGLDRRLLYFAQMYRKKLADSVRITTPTLHDAIDKRYCEIQAALQPVEPM